MAYGQAHNVYNGYSHQGMQAQPRQFPVVRAPYQAQSMVTQPPMQRMSSNMSMSSVNSMNSMAAMNNMSMTGQMPANQPMTNQMNQISNSSLNMSKRFGVPHANETRPTRRQTTPRERDGPYQRDPHQGKWSGSARGCKWGDDCWGCELCRDTHDHPNSVKRCQDADKPWGCQWGDECWFCHPSDTAMVYNHGSQEQYQQAAVRQIQQRHPSPSSDSLEQIRTMRPIMMGKVNVNDILIEYGHTNEDECRLNEKIGLYEHIDRMINILRYYSKIDVVNSRADKEGFLEFVEAVYLSLLQDYMSIMEQHCDGPNSKEDYQLIQEKKAKQFTAFGICTEKNCFLLCKCKGAKMGAPKMEKLSVFRHLMDSMHCYLVHGNDIGLRLKVCERAPRKPKWPIGPNDDKDKEFEFKGKLRVNRHYICVFATEAAQARSG